MQKTWNAVCYAVWLVFFAVWLMPASLLGYAAGATREAFAAGYGTGRDQHSC